MSDLETISDWLESHFNKYMTTYTFGDFVRLTNGSAGMYVDITIDGDSLLLSGNRYSESVDTECDFEKESLLNTLRRTI